jgi:hypothetical protein
VFAQRGQAGELRAGAIIAARFGVWSLERPDDVLGSDVAWVTVGALSIVDAFRFAHDALDIWLDCEKAWWVWRQVVQTDQATWRTRGGRPEVRIRR